MVFFWFIILELDGFIYADFPGNNIRTRTIYGLPFRSGYYGFATGDEVLPRYHLDMDLASLAAVVNMYVLNSIRDTSSQILVSSGSGGLSFAQLYQLLFETQKYRSCW